MLKKSSNNTILVSLVFFGLTMIVLLWGVLVGTEDLNQWKGFLEDLSKRPFLRPPKINYKRLINCWNHFSFPSFLCINHDCSFVGSADGNGRSPPVTRSFKRPSRPFKKGLFKGHKRLSIRDYKKILKILVKKSCLY